MNKPSHSLGAAKHILTERGVAPEDVECAIRYLREQFEVQEEQVTEALLSVGFHSAQSFVQR